MMQYSHIYTAFCIIIKLKVMFWKLYTRIYFNVGTFKREIRTKIISDMRMSEIRKTGIIAKQGFRHTRDLATATQNLRIYSLWICSNLEDTLIDSNIKKTNFFMIVA